MKATVLDGISRDLGEGATRRGLLRLLGGVTAIAALGAIEASGPGASAAAKRRRRKRGKRTKAQATSGQTEVNQPISGDETAMATSIPPNCIYVCCDGTCDSWKMCLKCVKWPKATTAPTVAIA